MKKFTSLFALLSCLGVYNAHAEGEVTVYVYGSYPQYQCLYWFNATEASPAWNHDLGIEPPKFTDLGEGTIVKDGDTFYKKTLTPKAGENINVVFTDPNNGVKTGDIVLTGSSEFYFYYFGDDKYHTTCPITLIIGGKFYSDSWSEESFQRNSMTNWTYTLSPTVTNNFDFGLKSNNKFFGKELSLDDTQGLVSTYDDNNNLVLNHASNNTQSYKLTATWVPSSNFEDISRWTLKIEGIGDDITLDDNTPHTVTGNFVANSAKYTRAIAEGKQWGTLCLPFGIDNTSKYDGVVAFYDLTNATSNSLTFSQVSSVAAGRPVVFKMENGQTELKIEETSASVTSNIGTYSINGWTVDGTFVSTQISTSYVIQNNELHPTGSNLTINPYRAWFSNGTTSAPLRIETDDATDIQFVEQEEGTVKVYYDLQGRKLDGARKGLVIENGKIIMVK